MAAVLPDTHRATRRAQHHAPVFRHTPVHRAIRAHGRAFADGKRHARIDDSLRFARTNAHIEQGPVRRIDAQCLRQTPRSPASIGQPGSSVRLCAGPLDSSDHCAGSCCQSTGATKVSLPRKLSAPWSAVGVSREPRRRDPPAKPRMMQQIGVAHTLHALLQTKMTVCQERILLARMEQSRIPPPQPTVRRPRGARGSVPAACAWPCRDSIAGPSPSGARVRMVISLWSKLVPPSAVIRYTQSPMRYRCGPSAHTASTPYPVQRTVLP